MLKQTAAEISDARIVGFIGVCLLIQSFYDNCTHAPLSYKTPVFPRSEGTNKDSSWLAVVIFINHPFHM
jgi:hypothetical protein